MDQIKVRTPAECRTLGARLMRWLLSLDGRIFQVYLYLFVLHLYYPMQRIYDKRHMSSSEPRDIRSQQNEISTGPARDDDVCSLSDNETNEGGWRWQRLPRLWPLLNRWRIVTTVWMIYVVIKYTFEEQIKSLIETLLQPDLPANCYLLGRFIFIQEAKRITAIFFASYHLIWRYLQVRIYNPLEMSSIYFLILDDRDICKYYSLLVSNRPEVPLKFRRAATQGGFEFEPELPIRDPQTNSREQMMNEIMSYRVDNKEKRVYRLRPNRTPEASEDLRRFMAQLTIICASIFLACGTIVTLTLVYQSTPAKRLISDYPGCDPRLEELVRNGQVGPDDRWLIGERIWFYFVWDLIENIILWVESGLVCSFSAGLVLIINIDLLNYWKALNKKIGVVLKVAREQYLLDDYWRHRKVNSGRLSTRENSRKSEHEQQNKWFNELVFDLQMEIQDLIKQIKQADQFMTDCITVLLVVWFSLYGFFIYVAANSHKGIIPLPYKLTLLVIAMIMSILCIDLLRLHRSFQKSYPLICSLMAYDRSEHKARFRSTIEYFVTKRTCFTLLRYKEMTATFYLSIVGWSFSCYFILSKIN